MENKPSLELTAQKLSAQQLTELLTQAKNDHYYYEEQLGKADEEWPAWYAKHVIDHSNGQITLSVEELSSKLLATSKDYEQYAETLKTQGLEAKPEDWRSWYANKMIDDIK